MNTLTSDFYIVGGNLRRDAPCYVERRADTDLYETLKRGEFCYILTSRQMGKSSLMVRVAHRLREEGTVVIALDLTQVGLNVTAEQWYDGLLTVIGRQLDLEDELEEFFCDEHQQLGPLQRWMAAIEEVVLARTQGPVVIFVDEIDVVRSLRERFSTDEFFAAIRHCYNARTDNDALRRLTFCLIGVATPTELIEDVRITPFNIGRRIELSDFTETEAAWFTQGLGREEAVAQQLLQRIFYWTNGHPYLIQRLCHAVASDPAVMTAAGVDRVCEEIFLSTRSQETDTNLSFVRDRLLRGQHDHAAILDLYQQVRRQKRVRDDETSPLINLLRLAGLVRVLENYLWVRNRIYFRVFDQAWIDANMPDAEKQRQRAAYRRGLIRATVAATAIITAIGGGIYWYFDSYVWEHETYCKQFVKHYGLPQCVGELTTQQVRGRALSYRLLRQGSQNPVYKVQAVREMNGQIALTNHHEVGTYFKSTAWWKPQIEKQWEFVVDTRGQIVYEKAFDENNELVWGLVYSPSLVGQPAKAHYVDAKGFPQPQQSTSAEFVEFEYSPEGYEIALRYFDRQHHPQLGPSGAFLMRRKFNEQGLVVEENYFDVQEMPVSIKDNDYHKWIARYDMQGNQIEGAFFGTDGQPILCKDGYHKWTIQHDALGNEIETALFGVNGQPILHKDGWHKGIDQYDARGNKIEESLFGINGQPVFYKNNRNFHKWVSRYDVWGDIVETAYFGLDGQPILYGEYGFHKFIPQHDKRGNVTEVAYFGTNGQPILHKDGFHKWTAKYDAQNNMIEWICFGISGQPTIRKDGYHKQIYQYDNHGNLIEVANFGIEGQPVLDKEGIHKWISQFDARGNEIERAYFDIKGDPVLHNRRNCHKRTLAYDDQGTQIAENHFDVNGNPLPTAIYVSSVTPDSPASQLGLQENDKITDYNGEAMSDVYRFLTLRRAEQPDQPAKELKIERQGKILTFQIPPKELEGMELENRAVSKGVN